MENPYLQPCEVCSGRRVVEIGRPDVPFTTSDECRACRGTGQELTEEGWNVAYTVNFLRESREMNFADCLARAYYIAEKQGDKSAGNIVRILSKLAELDVGTDREGLHGTSA